LLLLLLAGAGLQLQLLLHLLHVLRICLPAAASTCTNPAALL
jgi:hypothetical protein